MACTSHRRSSWAALVAKGTCAAALPLRVRECRCFPIITRVPEQSGATTTSRSRISNRSSRSTKNASETRRGSVALCTTARVVAVEVVPRAVAHRQQRQQRRAAARAQQLVAALVAPRRRVRLLEAVEDGYMSLAERVSTAAIQRHHSVRIRIRVALVRAWAPPLPSAPGQTPPGLAAPRARACRAQPGQPPHA